MKRTFYMANDGYYGYSGMHPEPINNNSDGPFSMDFQMVIESIAQLNNMGCK